MFAAATPTESQARPRVTAEPKAASPADPTRSARPSIASTFDPAYGTGLDGLPCQVRDPDLWFADSPADLEQAKSLCGQCPARAGCLSGALDRGEPWGVWGGEIFNRGEVVARKRPRGRPRKDEVAA